MVVLPKIANQLLVTSGATWAEGEWTLVQGAESLRNFMSGLKAERSLPNGEVARAEYQADGTGGLHEWGGSFPHTREIKGEDQVVFFRPAIPMLIDQPVFDAGPRSPVTENG